MSIWASQDFGLLARCRPPSYAADGDCHIHDVKVIATALPPSLSRLLDAGSASISIEPDCRFATGIPAMPSRRHDGDVAAAAGPLLYR